jgi:hypothetical protein
MHGNNSVSKNSTRPFALRYGMRSCDTQARIVLGSTRRRSAASETSKKMICSNFTLSFSVNRRAKMSAASWAISSIGNGALWELLEIKYQASYFQKDALSKVDLILITGFYPDRSRGRGISKSQQQILDALDRRSAPSISYAWFLEMSSALP